MQYPKISEYVKASQDASDNLDMSTKVTEEELNEAITDEFGVKYSKDGRKLLKALQELNGTYSIKEGVRIICNCAFLCRTSLRSVVIPDSVTSIGYKAFSVCASLRSVVIPNSVVCINGNPFGKWYGKLECLSPNFIYEDNVLFNKDKSKIISFRNQAISSYIIPSSVTSIGDSAFAGCFSLRNITIPNSVTSIGKSAFSGCDSLTNIVIPDSVTSIGCMAFSGCSSLKYISIPKSVICLNGNPFFDWNGKLECLSPYFIYEDEVLFNKDKSKIISCRVQGISSYIIPDSVTSIGDWAFSGCESLRSVVIPDSVTSIGRGAFRDSNLPVALAQNLRSRFGKNILVTFYPYP